MDLKTAYQKYIEVQKIGILDEIVDAGFSYLKLGGEFDLHELKKFNKFVFIKNLCIKIKIALKSGNELAIDQIWRFNKKLLLPHLQEEEIKKANVSSERIFMYPKANAILQTKNYKLINRLFDPFFFHGSSLFSENFEKKYETYLHVNNIMASIEKAMNEGDFRLILLAYPIDLEIIEDLINDKTREFIKNAREIIHEV